MIKFALPNIKIGKIMTKKVVTVYQEETIEALVKKFRKYDFHSFPVMDGDRLVGIVTKTDLLKVIDDTRLSNIAVAHVLDIMTHNPVCASSENLLVEAAHLMRENRVRILPVTDNQMLVGLLSYSDLVKNVFKV